MAEDISAVVDKIGTLVLIESPRKAVPFIDVGKDHQLVAVPNGKYSAKAEEVVKKITDLDSILFVSRHTKPGDPNYPSEIAYHCGICYDLSLRYIPNEPQQ